MSGVLGKFSSAAMVNFNSAAIDGVPQFLQAVLTSEFSGNVRRIMPLFS